jgi:hypothetical protein
MSVKTKRVIILILDTLFAVLLSLFFSNILTETWVKILVVITVSLTALSRIMIDIKVITQEEIYYGKVLKQIDEIEDHKYELRASIHKKMLMEIEAGNTSGYVTLRELYEQVGIK